MPDVVDAIVTFYESWKENGIGPDGLPLFEQVIMVRKAKPPLLQVTAIATENDQSEFPEAWRAFERQRKARDTSVQGYPLALWPVISPAELQMCLARDILTVEQLAPLAEQSTMPGQLKELANRAKKLIALQGKAGRFEAIITDLTGQRDALAEQLKEAQTTISAQNALIDTLKMRVA